MVALVATFVIGLSSTSAYANETDPAVTLFNEKCSGCHTIGGGSLVGPDMAPVAKWSQADITTAVKRMEKNVGPLSDDQISSLVKFLKDPSAGKLLKAQEQAVTDPGNDLAGVDTGMVEHGASDTGAAYFKGTRAFKNGGMACIACHQVDGAGGTMAPDLTHIADKMSEKGLASACQQTSFPVMKAAYREHPVIKQEALDLTAYFVSLKQPHEKKRELPVPLWGVALALVLLSMIGFGYRKRNTSIRSKLERR